ncbi:MAG: DUF3459 domain-containing protein [Chloroflexi bacterium]|nr:DUF3459 domain-containing protein [Chloroflexota bacterium]
MNEAGKPLWWQTGVIYQVYPRSFQDSNGDGIGDLNGVIQRLDYLHALGIDALWLSPFYPSPMADFGYDVADYVDVDPIFGTLADFDRLVSEAHRRDLRIIIDIVPNHSSAEHPWFKESRPSRTSPKRDWYVWADAKPDGSPPNNWLSNFGGSAWEWDEATGQYYLHSFLPEQPDLNWRNPALRQAMFDAIRFWLDRDVDGLRIDVAHAVMKDPDLRDDPPNPDPAAAFKPMGDYNSLLHIHSKGHADTHGVYRELRQILDSYSTGERPRFAVGEIHLFDWLEWASYYGADLDELHMPYNFSLLFAPWSAQAVRKVIDEVDRAVPPGGWPNFVLSNHDEHRLASRIGVEAARGAMLLLLSLRGTPTIYYGEELGMEDVPIPPELEQDPWGLRVQGVGVGRDPERTPMQWDSSANAGFADAGVHPWLPVAADYQTNNVAAQEQDPCSMLSLTRCLLALRRATPALHAGGYQSIDQANDQCFLFERRAGSDRWWVAINFSGSEQVVKLPGGNGVVRVSTHMDRDEALSSAAFRLRPHEGCLIQVSA